MSTDRGEMSYPKSGPASRAVALDLVLRTFMNSAEFQPSNPRIWDNIAKLVPGTTPQQCSQRWEVLRAASQNIVGDYTGLTAQGRPMSAHNQNHRRQLTKSLSSPHPHSSKSSQSECAASNSESRPHSVLGHRLSMGIEQSHSGTFVANFCQSVLSGGEREEGMRDCTGEKGAGAHSGMKSGNSDCTNGSSTQSCSSKPTNDVPSNHNRVDSSVQLGSLVGEHGPNMVIHVCDEAKKLKRDFTCPRDVLVREMRYFAGYLSSDTQLWDEVDISVHCDVPVFEWLMRYVKRGMLEGPSGEVLSEEPPTPQLEPSNAVSILISSDFLKMDNLVEECLDFCHENISTVVASPSNMGCLNDRLVGRLAAKFTPLEVENFVDKKNKIKSKLFIHQLQQLFSPSYSTPECPANASTLYKCRHCGRLLTAEQQTLLPCTAKRLSIDYTGRVVYSHERDPAWDITHHLCCMQREGLSPRDIYWRLWGVVNWLVCEHCHHPFQCGELSSCAYHPQPSLPSASIGGNPHHSCCQQPVSSFSVMPHQQNGCTFRDHSLSVGRTTTSLHPSSPRPTTRTSSSKSERLYIKDESTSERVYSVLLALREVICEGRLQGVHSKGEEGEVAAQGGGGELCLLQNEERKLRQHSPRLADASHTSQPRERDGTDYMPANMVLSSSSRQPLAQGVAMTTRKQSHDLSDLEEDDDDEDIPAQPPKPRKSKQTHPRSKQTRSDNQYPPLPVEWIWDSRKSKRWNQDMQRESDERRLAVLSVQLSHMNASSEHSSKSKEAAHAGGIFSQLEAQFRAQQAARALTVQATQARVQGSGRRKWSNMTQHC